MTFDYKLLTLGDLETYQYYIFVCDGDSKTITAIPKKEDK